MIKIYVHHWFTEELFIKLAHNTTNRVYDLTDYNFQKIGKVECEYNDLKIEFIFNPELNDNTDGYHLIDFFTSMRQKHLYDDYKDIDVSDGIEDTPFIKRFSELLKNRKGWIILLLRTEKIVDRFDSNDYHILRLETEIRKLKNHIIVSDNIFTNDKVELEYPYIKFALTNTIWQWNELINIKYWQEFSKIFEKLTFDYKLMYSIRRHKEHRTNILINLAKLNNDEILLQRAKLFVDSVYEDSHNILSEFDNIKINSIEDETDFNNLKLIEHKMAIEYDIFFRFLNLSQMQILDESWSWYRGDFNSQYLSEKTFGLILAKIPFISTHSYPLECIQKILDIRPHPFLNDFRNHKGNADKFGKFVKIFLENYNENYFLCKDWVDECHTKLIDKMEKENSFLELIKIGFQIHNKPLL